jgi:glycerol-3-phosphate acyltransferase PlsX
MKIAVDAMGGDNAPAVVVEGVVKAAAELDVPIILVGDKARVEVELKRHNTKDADITVMHASEVVEMDDSPIKSIRTKRDSSIRICFELVRDGEAGAVVSAGNSGAAMAAGILLLKKIKGVERPALAVSLPTTKDPAVLLDVGSNVDCKPINLVQFAIMGEVYARRVLGKKSPMVGLLSNGEEDAKGTDLTRESNMLLKKTTLNYVGYVEGRDIYRGNVDVVVTDGFVGNVVLKLSEGLVESVIEMLKKEIMSSISSKIGYFLARAAFKKLKKRIDYAEYGGAELLGINGTCVIGHGRSNAKAVKNAVIKACRSMQGDVNTHIAKEICAHPGILKEANHTRGVATGV